MTVWLVKESVYPDPGQPIGPQFAEYENTPGAAFALVAEYVS